MLERDVESYLVQQVTRLGGTALKLAPTEIGVPDRLLILPNATMHLVEVKAPTGRLSKRQRLWHRRTWERTRVPVHLVHSTKEVDDLLEGLIP